MIQCNSVILVEDEIDVREAAQLTLELEGFQVIPCSRAQQALQLINLDFAGVVVTDVKMPGINGIQLLQKISEIDDELPVIVVTGHGDIAMAVQAVRIGAYNFIEKPVAPEQLISEVSRALQTRQLVIENRDLKRQLSKQHSIDSKILGTSAVINQLKASIKNLADADVDILIHGETGTGKELVASCLHQFSKRNGAEFVALNCGALPESVIESELFGHEAGAFTGANKQRIGKIEYADGGTLFLDELESMPMQLQIKLLRVLQERKLERLGGNNSIKVDIRVIAATKCDLLEAANAGLFREDLYYRLNVATLNLPALRERAADIPLSFKTFVLQAAQRFSRVEPSLNAEQIQLLCQQHWRGNVRELQHEADRFVLGISALLTNSVASSPMPVNPTDNLPQQLASFEKRLIGNALQQTSGKIQEAADLLKIPRKKLYLRMLKLEIDKTSFGDNTTEPPL
ncbi:MAG: sigma-54 dependent DNA-binding response regulator [Osedax symbiont Rs1]|nr:MAG: sigma-54 dependent DNA-binding response regulator [Osedax symbiont Rs1]